MIARLEVVKGMPDPPCACVICGSNPSDENTGEQLHSIYAPGVDVDWGGSLYICLGCAGIIADLIDRVPEEEHDKLKQEFKELVDEHTALEEEHQETEEKVAQIRQGVKAKKDLQQPRKKKKAA